MNRKIIVLLILISLFGVIGVTAYGFASGTFDSSDKKSEVSSEVKSDISSETKSNISSEVTSQTIKDPNEGVNTSVPATKSETTPQVEGDSEAKYDENGDLRKDSKYLDDDGDTVANYYDICPGVDDFGSDCKTDAYDSEVDSEVAQDTPAAADQPASTTYDENGDLVSDSKYLDEDGDTVANYYDICPGVDDFGSNCKTA